jgi:ABC-2 type transport system permease protein
MAAPDKTLSLGVVGQMMVRWRYGFLLESLIVRDIRVKYRRSALGIVKYGFVLAVVGANLLGFLIALAPLAAIMVGLGHTMTPALLFLPVSLVFLTLFTTGVALLFSTVAVFFDDLTQFYNVLLQALMYLSAIFYPVDIIPPPLRVVVYLNPMYYLVQMVRYPIYYGTLPPPLIVAGCVVGTAAALFAGVKVFAWASNKFVYYA